MTHVTVGARTSDPLHRRRALYLKSYLDSLLLAIRNFYLGRQAGRHRAPPVHVYTVRPARMRSSVPRYLSPGLLDFLVV